MKRNVFENKSDNELRNYILSSFVILDDASGITDDLSKDEYEIHDDNSVSFYTGVDYCNTNGKPIDIKIKYARHITFDLSFDFDNTDCLPQKCNSLTFNDCLVKKKNVIINSDIVKYLEIDYNNREDVFFESLTCNSRLKLQQCSITRCKINDLFFNIPLIERLHIVGCDIDIFSNIHIHEVLEMYCLNTNIKSFNNIQNFNNKIKKSLEIDIQNIKSFKDIENCKIDKVKLRNVTTDNNMILCLLSGINDITIHMASNTYSYALSIINYYLDDLEFDFNQRKDHVMDCAVELIDAGFEEAAEI